MRRDFSGNRGFASDRHILDDETPIPEELGTRENFDGTGLFGFGRMGTRRFDRPGV
jgi:hypothetical protein